MSHFVLFLVILSGAPKIYSSEIPKVLNDFKVFYKQERFIKNTDIVLRSNGHAKVKKNKKIEWTQKRPFYFKVDIIDENITIISKDGRMSKARNPFVKHLSSFLFDIINGDFERLKESFTVVKGKGASNRFILTPKNSEFKKALLKIVAVKNNQIEEIMIYEINGNTLNIKFNMYDKVGKAIE